LNLIKKPIGQGTSLMANHKMKLKFYINSDGKKIYTLKDSVNNQKTKDAHYKFIKIRDALPSDAKIVRRN
jgi:hypothetical protein